MNWKNLVAAAILATLPFAAGAVEPDEVLDDPVLEARARGISKVLRCLVCRSENIDNSNAGVARDLRLLVRERLTTGDTDEEVIDYIRARFGDYVLLKPPFKPEIYVLWLAPAALMLIGGIGVIGILRKSGGTKVVNELDDDEKRIVAEILASEKKERV
ncbi:cytochrome c-type biogenesis protein CcmH [Sulfitobacter sp. M220]|jgi:cytochrome c-type biogenesis protein CcmH|uniref:cytochrome c-type biogenesis protein n=1 Tax=Sulfitobacter sp. M220 TaxID=2675333 RepID=UPI001F37623A|nr:cytochrome c-type biogenesis protein [Sulfitobacter sp. M220]MCF7779581.1 cytochrome c-type biogenesis protein CcmH [Sulfitobacter sp. M220]|tara:strand:+ start:17627 stop:18103 length:477 start_codon:yes stop_codon:yes gene_type:complete